MNFFRRQKIKPEVLAETICNAFTEEELGVLNSSDCFDFKNTLIKEIYKTDFKFKLIPFEKAIPKAKIIVEAANFYCHNPITEKELIFYCKCLKNTFLDF